MTDLQRVRKALHRHIVAANKSWMAAKGDFENVAGQAAVDALEDFSATFRRIERQAEKRRRK